MTKNIGTVNTSASFAVFYAFVNTIAQVLANEIVTANSAPGGGAMSIGNGFVSGIFGANTLVGSQIQGGNVTTTNTLFLGSNLTSNGASVTITVGASTLNATMLDVGNSTVFSTVTSTTLTTGNSTVNTTINSTSISTGSVIANLTSSFVNASFNAIATALEFVSTAITVGANVVVNTSTFSVANTVANAVVNTAGFFYNGAQLTVPPSINTPTTGLTTQTIDSFATTLYRTVEYTLSVTDNNANNFQASKVLLVQSGGLAFATEYAVMVSNNPIGTFSTTISGGNALLQFTPISSSSTTVKGARVTINV